MRLGSGRVCATVLAAAAAVWLLRRYRRQRLAAARTAAHTAAQTHVVVRRVRHCVPYEATSTHVVKDRHAGVPAAAMLQAILGADAAFWSGEIVAGRVTLPHGRTACAVLVAGDTLRVTRHIHEQAVIATEVPRLLYEDDELLVVDKPAGVPTVDDVPGASRAYRLQPDAPSLQPDAPSLQLQCTHPAHSPLLQVSGGTPASAWHRPPTMRAPAPRPARARRAQFSWCRATGWTSP